MNNYMLRMAVFSIAALGFIASGYSATDAEWQAMARYEYGQDMAPLLAIDREVIGAMASPAARSACAARLAALLEAEGTTPAAKQYICLQLRQVGTAAEVPLLTRMLADPQTSQMARYALESIPGEESPAALRDSLSVLQGDLLVGAINSLAARKDVKAVARLKELASGGDDKVAGAALWALGNIADLESAAYVLEKAGADSGPLSLQAAVCLLRAAEALASTGRADTAMLIYKNLSAPGQPTGIRRAALAAILKQEKDEGRRRETVVAWLSDSDAERCDAAASCLGALPEAELDRLAANLSQLPEKSRPVLIAALAVRKKKDALPLLLPLVQNGDGETKLAAVLALGQSGDIAAVPILTDCLAAEESVAAAARQSLTLLPREAVGTAMLAALAERPEIRGPVLEVLKQLKYYEAIDPLLEIAAKGDAAAYEPALAALAEIADPDMQDLSRLLKLMTAVQGKHRDQVERTIFIVCRKAPAADRAKVLLDVLGEPDAAGLPPYLPLLGRLGGKKTLEIVTAAMQSDDAELKAAGVRALCNWPDASVADRLLSLAETSKDNSHRTWALRAYVRVVTLKSNRPESETLEMLQKAMTLAAADAERRLIIERAAAVRTIDSLRWITPYLDDPALNQAACMATVELAHHRFLRTPNRAEFAAALQKVVKIANDPQVVERAKRYLLGM